MAASAPGGAASATITGTAPAQTLNLVIPRGETGPQGPQGAVGPQGPAGPGSGDVLGPGAAVTADALVQWSGTAGTNIKDVTFSGLVKLIAGVPSAALTGTDYVVPSGNVATATALQTARTLTIGSTGKSFNGSVNVSWTLAEIGAQAADADLTAIAALTGTSGLLRKTAANTWALETTAYAPLASPALTGTPTAPTAAAKTNTTQVATTAFADRLRSFLTGITSGMPTTADRGCLLQVTAGFTLPAHVFAAGDTFSIYNNSASNITLTQGTNITLRLGGTATTGNRTLAQRGIATVVFISATEAVIGGMGLT